MMFILFVTIVTVLIIYYISNYISHVVMSLTEGTDFGFSNFLKFLKYFKAYKDWKVNEDWVDIYHFFGNKIIFHCDYQIYAGIIKFNNKCMILDPISFILFDIWKRYKWKKMYAMQYNIQKIKPKLIKWK